MGPPPLEGSGALLISHGSKAASAPSDRLLWWRALCDSQRSEGSSRLLSTHAAMLMHGWITYEPLISSAFLLAFSLLLSVFLFLSSPQRTSPWCNTKPPQPARPVPSKDDLELSEPVAPTKKKKEMLSLFEKDGFSHRVTLVNMHSVQWRWSRTTTTAQSTLMTTGSGFVPVHLKSTTISLVLVVFAWEAKTRLSNDGVKACMILCTTGAYWRVWGGDGAEQMFLRGPTPRGGSGSDAGCGPVLQRKKNFFKSSQTWPEHSYTSTVTRM